MRRIRRIWRAALLAALLPVPALAGEAAEKAREPVQVQVDPFEVMAEGAAETAFFTLFLDPVDQEHLWKLCRRLPRVRDAVLSEVLTNRLKVDAAGDLRLQGVAAQLLPLVNRALGEDWVRSAHVAAGEYGTPWAPEAAPPVPNPRSCGQIEFRTKRIR